MNEGNIFADFLSETLLLQNGGISIADAEIPAGKHFVDEVKLEVAAAFDEVDAVGRRDANGDDDEVNEEVKADR